MKKDPAIIQSDTEARFKPHLEEETSPMSKKDLIKAWDDIHLNLLDFKSLKKILAESKNRKGF